jgi:DNA-binding transcriptional ArsR family regulator
MKTTQAVAALAALAQPTRLSVYRLLVEAGPGGLPAGTIAARLGVAAPTLSFHLKELAHADLVRSESRGRFVVYRADYATMNALLGYLTANCCRGGECTVSGDVVRVAVPTPGARTTRTDAAKRSR